MSNSLLIEKLNKITQKFRGSISELSDKDWNRYRNEFRFYEAPFTNNLAIIWEEKKIVWKNKEPPWPHIIHEMGHLFACTDEEYPGSGEDENSFFGWEYLLAKKIKGSIEEWNNDNNDYGCFFKAEGLCHDFGMLTKKKKKEFVDSCIEAGINKGSIKKNRNHTYTLMSLRS